MAETKTLKEVEKLIYDLREYAENSGYNHGDYADTMRIAADVIAALAAEGEAKPVAWAAFAENGNIRIWTSAPEDARRLAEQSGFSIVPLYTSPQPADREKAASSDNGGKTGWPPGLLQDDSKKLSKWLASKPDAKECVRRVCSDHVAERKQAAQQPTKVKPEDVIVETWQLSRPSGFSLRIPQGIRLTHKPSGIVVTSESEGSQHKNKDIAWRKLEERLAQQGEHPPLPEPYWEMLTAFTADQMHAYLDSDRAQRHAVELTDEQIDELWDAPTPVGGGRSRYDIARAIIAADRAARGGAA